jgi:DNA repair exonuclease SbcCD nuclease subunit
MSTPSRYPLTGLSGDWHLGKRLGYRVDERGVNARSRDLERAAAAVVDGFIAERVEVAIIAGDLFDAPTPPEHARQALVREVSRLRAALPGATIILLRGNHDAKNILTDGTAVGTAALALPGVEVVDAHELRIIRHGDTAYHCLPWMLSDEAFLRAVEAMRPDPSAGRNIAVFHCGMADLPEYADLRPGSQTITRSMIPAGFDAIFSGHYHGHRHYPELNWTFIGAPERLSISESADPKGWIRYEPESGAMRQVPTHARPWYDLRVSGAGKSAGELTAEAVAACAAIPDLEGSLLRLRLEGVDPGAAAGLDVGAIRRVVGRAFHHELSLTTADPAIADAADAGGERGDGAPLFGEIGDEWRRFIDAAPLDPAARERIERLGLAALDAA